MVRITAPLGKSGWAIAGRASAAAPAPNIAARRVSALSPSLCRIGAPLSLFFDTVSQALATCEYRQSDQAQRLEAGDAVAADDQMVVDSDTQDLQRLDDLTCHVDV